MTDHKDKPRSLQKTRDTSPIFRNLFRFSDAASAVQRQRTLATSVIETTPIPFDPTLVCGLDAAYTKDKGIGVAAVWNRRTSQLVEVRSASQGLAISYRPGFLSYREGPIILAAARKLRVVPDAFLADGHGRAHPRKFGLACHIGLALAKPTIGVAKSHLYGRMVNDTLTDPNGSLLGRILTVEGRRPYYVSVGHLVALDEAFKLVKSCMHHGRIAPLYAAHVQSSRLMEGTAD